MAAAEIRPKMRLWEGDTCTRLCRLIRHPVVNGILSDSYPKFVTLTISSGKDPSSDLICSIIIPAIAHLRRVYPLRLTMFFPTSFLDTFLANNDIDLTDFTTTDVIMDQLYIMQ